MKNQTIDARIDSGPDIPGSIERGILNLFGVASINDMSRQEKERIKSVLAGLFGNTSQTDYLTSCREYALYYLPLNFYKIWRPLMDLLAVDRLPTKCKILELGAGPGSSTFGLIELYKYLAYDNRFTEFILEITVVERDAGFVEIFRKLYSDYSSSLPQNLSVSIDCRNEDAFLFVNICPQAFYNLVIESNMLNPNERVEEGHQNSFVIGLKAALAPHSSVIFIEPAKQSLTLYFKQLKRIMLMQGFFCFSPCRCPHINCEQFASARIDVQKIGIYYSLSANGLIRKTLKNHSFEYAVFRNDELPKYEYEGTDNILSNLIGHKGERIKFKAFILTFAKETDESFSLKICDGSLCDKSEVWLYIPKSILLEDSISCLTSGRGGLIEIKDAIVVAPNQIRCALSTQLKIYR